VWACGSSQTAGKCPASRPGVARGTCRHAGQRTAGARCCARAFPGALAEKLVAQDHPGPARRRSPHLAQLLQAHQEAAVLLLRPRHAWAGGRRRGATSVVGTRTTRVRWGLEPHRPAASRVATAAQLLRAWPGPETRLFCAPGPAAAHQVPPPPPSPPASPPPRRPRPARPPRSPGCPGTRCAACCSG
jgi:hypothetical protein